MGNQSKRASRAKVHSVFRIDRGVMEYLSEWAAADGVSRNQLVTLLLRFCIAAHRDASRSGGLFDEVSQAAAEAAMEAVRREQAPDRLFTVPVVKRGRK